MKICHEHAVVYTDALCPACKSNQDFNKLCEIQATLEATINELEGTVAELSYKLENRE